MEAIVSVFETSLINVGVNLCGGNVGVPQHFLDDSQIATIFEKMRRKTVTQRVRRDVFGNACFAGVFLDVMPDRLAIERAAARRKENLAALSTSRERRARLLQVTTDAGCGLFANRHDAFLAAFADNPQEARVEINVAQGNLGDLAHAQSGGVHELEHCLVAQTESGACHRHSEQPVHLIIGQHVGERSPQTGRINRLRWIVCQQFLADEEPAEHSERRELTGQAARADIVFTPVHQKIRDVLALNAVHLADATTLDELDELRQVHAVGNARVLRQAAFDGQIIQESIHQMLHAYIPFTDVQYSLSGLRRKPVSGARRSAGGSLRSILGAQSGVLGTESVILVLQFAKRVVHLSHLRVHRAIIYVWSGCVE